MYEKKVICITFSLIATKITGVYVYCSISPSAYESIELEQISLIDFWHYYTEWSHLKILFAQKERIFRGNFFSLN